MGGGGGVARREVTHAGEEKERLEFIVELKMFTYKIF